MSMLLQSAMIIVLEGARGPLQTSPLALGVTRALGTSSPFAPGSMRIRARCHTRPSDRATLAPGSMRVQVAPLRALGRWQTLPATIGHPRAAGERRGQTQRLLPESERQLSLQRDQA